jgi:exodeoxyribonuclease VII large subunit
MRLPFDPQHAAGPPGPAPPRKESIRCLSVTQLATLIRATLETGMALPVAVRGQVSNLSAREHWYFSLKDQEAVVHCVAWASSVRRFGFTPRDGDEVIAAGHVGHYPRSGRTQLYVEALRPAGEGELERRFRAMCEELRRLGYFDEARKRPLPAFPRRIAVVTSAQGAAAGDVIATAAQRCRAVGLLLVDVRVQGPAAAAEIAAAVRWVDANRDRLGVDALLLTRGGGSLEDLAAFNERPVADAIHACCLPVVAAIGHESDTTVAELVADLRASTPTQAAMRLVPAAAELLQEVEHVEHRLVTLVRGVIQQRSERLRLVQMHEIFRRPRRWLEGQAERLQQRGRHLRGLVDGRVAVSAQALAQAGARLERAGAALLRHRRARLEDRVERLAAVDPRLVLRRGYSYTTDQRGRVIRSVAGAEPGQVLVTHLADGELRSVVDLVTGRE